MPGAPLALSDSGASGRSGSCSAVCRQAIRSDGRRLGGWEDGCRGGYTKGRSCRCGTSRASPVHHYERAYCEADTNREADSQCRPECPVGVHTSCITLICSGPLGAPFQVRAYEYAATFLPVPHHLRIPSRTSCPTCSRVRWACWQPAPKQGCSIPQCSSSRPPRCDKTQMRRRSLDLAGWVWDSRGRASDRNTRPRVCVSMRPDVVVVVILAMFGRTDTALPYVCVAPTIAAR